MLDPLKRCPFYLTFGVAMVVGCILLEMSGVAFGGSRKAQKVDPGQIRSSSPGSWTYIYWAHGSRGK